MKAVIFAGGVGTRMWPLSREATPKQFEKIIDGKSTLQLAVDRISPEFRPRDIYISTGQQYVDIVRQQLPQIPADNVIGEPVMRDVGPAVGYIMSILSVNYPDNPTAILWSDHLVNNLDTFKQVLQSGGEYLRKHPSKIVFIGQKARFASQNLGWIEYGKEIETVNGMSLKQYVSWHYRPNLATATKYLEGGKHAWNPGYFVVTPRFVMDQFKKFAPQMHRKLSKIKASYGKPDHQKILNNTYPTLEKISFDNLILENLPPKAAVVISADLGWSDIGAWEALKEALQSSPDQNVVHGNIKTRNTTDSLIYSYTDQLVSTIDVDGMVVVVTPDVILVTKKDSIPEVKKLVNELKDSDLKHFT